MKKKKTVEYPFNNQNHILSLLLAALFERQELFFDNCLEVLLGW